ncbi:TEX12 protein, partial [Heliornis fulica]|nr:TEX12 protein [Heliornis fulica]
ENTQLSSIDKTDVALSGCSQSLYKPESLEKELNGDVLNNLELTVKLFSGIFFQLSERAAMDASYIQELDGIVKEARTLENHLKQKRESLKQRFNVIASTL